ncbi:MAG: HD-GYP domain-containing protein [Methylophilaceae bacterium]
MLKTISTKQVRLGMHIHELKGAWVNHPFWKSKFIIDSPKDLARLQASIVKEVVIDVSKGLDIEKNKSQIIEQAIENLTSPQEEKPVIKKISAAEESKAAKRLIIASRKAVQGMFSDVRMGKAVNVEAVMPLVDEISASIERNQGALISLARLKTQDDYTYMHSVAVCALMTALGKQLGLDDLAVKQAGLAGLLHDVGKAAIRLEILNKPGALTEDEFKSVKLHPEKGYALLQQAGITDEVALDVCLHHHEKMDGTGYPHQLQGDNISHFARMGAICDVYDAITSNRPYKSGWEPSESLKKMASWNGHFDLEILKAFVRSVGIYPIGSVVLLKSKRMGVVVDQSTKSLLTPVVKVFFSIKSKSRIPIKIVDLSKPASNDEVEALEKAENWGIYDVDELWSEPSV